MIQLQFPFTASLSDRPLTPTTPSATAASTQLSPGLEGFTYESLRDVASLPKLTAAFDDFARARLDAATWSLFEKYRASKGEGMSAEEVSDALVKTAPAVADFVAKLFRIEEGRERLRADVTRESVVFDFKRDFVKKRTARRKRTELDGLDADARRALDAQARAVLSAATGSPDQWNDEREVALAVMPLVRAEDLVNDRTILVERALREVTYVHVLFETHQVIWANGVATESFHPANAALDALEPAQRAGLMALFPGLAADPSAYGAPARRNLTGSEAAILRHDMGQ